MWPTSRCRTFPRCLRKRSSKDFDNEHLYGDAKPTRHQAEWRQSVLLIYAATRTTRACSTAIVPTCVCNQHPPGVCLRCPVAGQRRALFLPLHHRWYIKEIKRRAEQASLTSSAANPLHGQPVRCHRADSVHPEYASARLVLARSLVECSAYDR